MKLFLFSSLKIKTRIEIRKVCLLNGNQPMRSNPHELSALLAQHVICIGTHTQQPIFELDGLIFSHVASRGYPHTMWPYTKLTK